MTRPVTPRPTLFYRALRPVVGMLARRLFDVRVTGVEHLPRDAGGRLAGGWICAVVPHRNWSEPFLLIAVLPAERRIVAVADAATVTRSRWRRATARLLGGVVAVGGAAGRGTFGEHVAQAASALSAGAVLAIAPEVGPPSRPPELRRLSRGLAHFAMRTRAGVVPVVFGGTHELFLRRRIEVRVLPPLPPPAATAARADVEAWAARFREVTESAARRAHAAAEIASPRRKRWRWLTGNYPRSD